MSVVKQNFGQRTRSCWIFGCGKGDCSLIFSRIGYEVFGFDISPNNIAIANRLADKYGMTERTYFQVSAAEELDYPNDFFDAVVGTDILHLVEISQVLPECSRVLKKGGLAIFPRADTSSGVRWLERNQVRELVGSEGSFARTSRHSG